MSPPIEDLHEDRDIRTSALLFGHIRLGVFDTKRGAPRQTETFVFTSPDRQRLEPIARDFGGELERYEPQGGGEEPWRVVSETDAFTALFPGPWADENVAQSWELWARSGPSRFCTGKTCELISYDEETGERLVDSVECICRRQGTRECKAETHIRLLLPQTGLGIWELTTGSKIGAIELYDQARFIDQITNGMMNRVPIRVIYRPREIHYFDAKKRERHSTTKRIVSLSVAGDAAHALAALAVTEERGLVEVVRAALADTNGGAPALTAGGDAAAGGGAGAPPPSSEPEAVEEPAEAPPRSTEEGTGPGSDAPASRELWAKAADKGLKGSAVLKKVRELELGQPRSISAITDSQLRAVMETAS